MKKYRLGFVGVGRVADMYFASVKAMHERAELVAICDVRPEALELRQREWNVPGFKTIEELLAHVEVDALCLLLPHDVHREYVEVAARHRKHVYLEKPIANSCQEARRIAAVVRQSGITLLVGHTGLFHPSFKRVLEFIKKGWLGRPLFGRGTSAGWLSFRPWDFRLNKQQTGGGCWVDAGGHLVYCMREIFGEVDRVTGVTGCLARTEMQGEDHAAAVLRYTSGAIAELFVSYGHKLPGYQYDWPLGYLNAIEIYGDAGAIQYIISPEPEVRYFSEIPEAMPHAWQGWLTYKSPEPYTYSFHGALAHFLDCLDTGAQPRVTAEDALATLDVLFRLYDQCK